MPKATRLHNQRRFGTIIKNELHCSRKGGDKMAKEVIDEIRAAEDSARQTNTAAQDTAYQTIEAAKAKAKKIAEQAKADAAERAKQIIATAENEAYKVKTRAAEENARSVRAEYIPDSGRQQKAAEYIISKITQ